MRRCLAALAVTLAACGPSTSADPVFISTEVSDVVVFGGDCAENRCVSVTAPVDGSKDGEGSCALYGPGDPDTMEPLAESGPLQMEPGKDVVWEVQLPEEVSPTSQLNPVCEPMSEG